MSSYLLRLAAAGFMWLAGSTSCVLAQTSASSGPLPTHTIRSISPTDTEFSDLEFLRQEIGGARVVMLGEPTHGEGNVFEAKIRLMRFLQERMGFTTVAFESGFYELDRAQSAMQAGTPAAEAIGNSVLPVWTNTREFLPILPLVGPGRLKVAGFDGQQTGTYGEDMMIELEELLNPEKGADGLAYDYLAECTRVMHEEFSFPKDHQLLLFNMQVGKARKLLEKVAAGPDKLRRERAMFWLQNLRSLQAMAHDYATNDPAHKTEAEFKAADNNPRDAQMADNLLWYVRQHPQEKIICWGALPHLSNKVEALNDAELKAYQPMGRAVKAALGDDAVYVLGTLAGGGTHGPLYWGAPKPVPAPAAGTLEAALLAQRQPYSFLSLKHAAKGQELTTYAIGYIPVTGRWSEVVDGFLFLPAVNPPHPTPGVAAAATTTTTASLAGESDAASPLAGRLGFANPALRPATAPGSGALLPLRGTVRNAQTGQPVPFATIAAPGRGAAAVADAEGRFTLSARWGEALQISSVGYQGGAATAGTAPLVVRLAPASYALANVRVSAASQDPKLIMQKVIKAIPQNYRFGEDAAELYTYRRISNYDTVRYAVEYLNDVLVPANYNGRTGPMGVRPKMRVRTAHPLAGSQQGLSMDALFSGQGADIWTADAVRAAPLFKAGNLKKYDLRLDTILHTGSQITYVIGFRATDGSRRAMDYSVASYTGQVQVDADTYAVTHYEALAAEDTVKDNAATRRFFREPTATSGPSVFSSLYTDWRYTHAATYVRQPDGRYQIATSQLNSVMVGRSLASKKSFHYQSTAVLQFGPVPPATVAELKQQPTDTEWEFDKVQKAPTDATFWQTYQRPIPAEPAPTLEAGK